MAQTPQPSSASGRMLDIFELLAHMKRPLPAREMSERLRIPRGSLYRLLKILIQRGYLDKRGSGYCLGLRMLTIGETILNELDIREVAYEPIVKLLEATGETAELAIPDRGEMIFVHRAENLYDPIRVHSRVGMRVDNLHTTGHSKVMLAFLPEEERERYLANNLVRVTEETVTDPLVMREQLEAIRKNGWGYDDQEHTMNVRRFAAAIFNHRGEFFGAVGIAGPTFRLRLAREKEVVPMIMEAARSITANLGGNYPYPVNSRKRK